MKITLTLEIDDPNMVDEDHEMGITNDAYEELSDALTNAGFMIDSGPDRA